MGWSEPLTIIARYSFHFEINNIVYKTIRRGSQPKWPKFLKIPFAIAKGLKSPIVSIPPASDRSADAV